MVDQKVKKLFKAFLAQQGMTIDFSLAIKPIYDSIDHYLDVFPFGAFDAINLLTLAFDWDNTNHGADVWRYHNRVWQIYLEAGLKNESI